MDTHIRWFPSLWKLNSKCTRKLLAHLRQRQAYAIPRKPQAFALQPKMASGHVFATVGTTKFDLFISTLSCQKVLRVSEHHPLQLIIKADTLKISLLSAT